MNIVKSKFFWITLSVAALIAAFITVIPKAIDMDLKKIGTGQPSVVFIYDPNLGVSNQQSTAMNKARESMNEQAIFLIAEIGDPQSAGFRNHYQAQPAELLFFSPQGEFIDRQFAPLSAAELTTKLLQTSP